MSEHSLANHDTGLDLKDNNSLSPKQDTYNIDMFLINLFCQIVIDIKCKTPNLKDIKILSYSRLN